MRAYRIMVPLNLTINPTSICNKRRVYLRYITNFDDIIWYSQEYTIIINDDCSRLSHVRPTAQFLASFEENEWPRRIESRVCICLFNYLAKYFFAFYYHYITFYCMLYEHIWILLNIFHLIIDSCHTLLISSVDVLCCFLGSNLGHIFCDADTLTTRLFKPMMFCIHFVYQI